MAEDQTFQSRSKITWFEFLVVIGAIAVLLGICLPACNTGHVASRRAVCLNNLRNIALATICYESSFSRLPSGAGTKGESVLVRIMPMLEYKPLYDDFRSDKLTPAGLSAVELDLYFCPNSTNSRATDVSPGEFTSHYVASAGPVSDQPESIYSSQMHTQDDPAMMFDMGDQGKLGLRGLYSPRVVETDAAGRVSKVLYRTKTGIAQDEVADGVSNTISFMESSRYDHHSNGNPSTSFTNVRTGWAYGQQQSESAGLTKVFHCRSIFKPINSNDSATGIADPIHELVISSNHSGGANVANGDGSVHFVDEKIDLEILQAAAGIDEGLVGNLGR